MQQQADLRRAHATDLPCSPLVHVDADARGHRTCYLHHSAVAVVESNIVKIPRLARRVLSSSTSCISCACTLLVMVDTPVADAALLRPQKMEIASSGAAPEQLAVSNVVSTRLSKRKSVPNQTVCTRVSVSSFAEKHNAIFQPTSSAIGWTLHRERAACCRSAAAHRL